MSKTPDQKKIREEIEASRARLRDALKPPKGPTDDPVVPEGHELAGQSSLLNADGTLRARWDKTRVAGTEEPTAPILPEGFSARRVSTFVRADGSIGGQWISADADKQAKFDDFWAACESAASVYEGRAVMAPGPARSNADLQTWYLYGDPHWGMLSWAPETGKSHDIKTAGSDLLSATSRLLARSPDSEIGVFCNVGDMWHAQDDRQATPGHGNKLDVDCRFGKVVETGLACNIQILDMMLLKHSRVVVIHVPGNHDPDMARMTALYLSAWYRNEPRIEIVPNFNPYIYRQFGSNFIVTAHGDGAKPQDMPGIAAADRPDMWGSTVFRVCFMGHVHHLTRKEFPGMTVETIRTLAPADYWHHWKGYRARQACTSVTFHRDFGEESRAVVSIEQAREAA